jgi:tetratricopeptide (TPR) repeat protein
VPHLRKFLSFVPAVLVGACLMMPSVAWARQVGWDGRLGGRITVPRPSQPSRPSGGGGTSSGASSVVTVDTSGDNEYAGSYKEPSVDRRALARSAAYQAAEAWEVTAKQHFDRGEYQRAIEIYDKALKVYYTKDRERYYNGEKWKARFAWREVYLARARSAADAGRYDAVFEELKQAERILYNKRLQQIIDEWKKSLAEREDLARKLRKEAEQAAKNSRDAERLAARQKADADKRAQAASTMPPLSAGERAELRDAPADTSAQRAAAATGKVQDQLQGLSGDPFGATTNGVSAGGFQPPVAPLTMSSSTVGGSTVTVTSPPQVSSGTATPSAGAPQPFKAPAYSQSEDMVSKVAAFDKSPARDIIRTAYERMLENDPERALYLMQKAAALDSGNAGLRAAVVSLQNQVDRERPRDAKAREEFLQRKKKKTFVPAP